MPELPEVQATINSIKPKIVISKITACDLICENVIYNLNHQHFKKYVIGKTIFNISRRGKYIIFHLEDGYILCHLRMTGNLFIDKNNIKEKYVRAKFVLMNQQSTWILYFRDVRKFGGFYYYRNLLTLNRKLGADPFDVLFGRKWLFKGLQSRNRQIKGLMLDQSFICGLGNIYTDEILWLSKIHPQRKSSEIIEEESNTLHRHIISLLVLSICFHGTSIKDFVYDNMKTGRFKNYLKVYNRSGQNCFRCNNMIIKMKNSGRGTHICEYCQV